MLERNHVEDKVRKLSMELPVVLNSHAVDEWFDGLINEFSAIGHEEQSLLQVLVTDSVSGTGQNKPLVCSVFVVLYHCICLFIMFIITL